MANTIIKADQGINELIVITAFYKFYNEQNTTELQIKLKELLNKNNILGTILLANEGINGTICGYRQNIDIFYDFVQNQIGDVVFKETYAEFSPFGKLKVKIKPEIVTIGIDIKSTPGAYIKPQDWDAAVLEKDTIVIDTRNDYEYYIGTFANAVNPNTTAFRTFPEWINNNLTEADKNKKILMFCTGGVRCEKSTALMKDEGFNNVYHLEGGIIGYLIAKKDQPKTWKGNCFVFDERVIIDENLKS